MDFSFNEVFDGAFDTQEYTCFKVWGWIGLSIEERGGGRGEDEYDGCFSQIIPHATKYVSFIIF